MICVIIVAASITCINSINRNLPILTSEQAARIMLSKISSKSLAFVVVAIIICIGFNSSLALSLSGDIKKGSEVTLVAEVSSAIDLDEEAILGLVSLPDGIELISVGVLKLQLEAGVPEEVGFDLRLNDTGEYILSLALKLSFDRIDYETIHKDVYLLVNESDGEFFELEPQE